jgi:hypothetical protein
MNYTSHVRHCPFPLCLSQFPQSLHLLPASPLFSVPVPFALCSDVFPFHSNVVPSCSPANHGNSLLIPVQFPKSLLCSPFFCMLAPCRYMSRCRSYAIQLIPGVHLTPSPFLPQNLSLRNSSLVSVLYCAFNILRLSHLSQYPHQSCTSVAPPLLSYSRSRVCVLKTLAPLIR